jgi:Tol biopolymer transport system component
MTSTRRFEQDLPALLDDLYVAGTPDYRDDLVRRTAAIRQRPAWTFPERWLPMGLATRRLPFAAVPLRALIVLALILILAAAAILLSVGSRHPVLPPFGPAANGFIIGSSGGDIVVRDTATGESHLLIGGADSDTEPGASPDGMLVGFTRTVSDNQYLTIANIDGTNVRRVLDAPLIDAWAQWAPDSRHLGVITSVNRRREFHLVSTEGGPETVADMGDLVPAEFQFRPPDGREIVVRAADRGLVDLYLMNVDGSNPRKLGLGRNSGFLSDIDLQGASWSPTGAQLAYNDVADHDGLSGIDRFRVHVLEIESKRDVEYPAPADPDIRQAWPMWSPDGTNILVQRFTKDEGWLAILPANGSSAVREVGPRVRFDDDTRMDEGWSPDGKIILLRFDDDHFYAIDVATGNVTPVTWPVDRIPDWRRVAP